HGSRCNSAVVRSSRFFEWTCCAWLAMRSCGKFSPTAHTTGISPTATSLPPSRCTNTGSTVVAEAKLSPSEKKAPSSTLRTKFHRTFGSGGLWTASSTVDLHLVRPERDDERRAASSRRRLQHVAAEEFGPRAGPEAGRRHRGRHRPRFEVAHDHHRVVAVFEHVHAHAPVTDGRGPLQPDGVLDE